MKPCEFITLVIMIALCVMSMFYMFAWINSPTEFVFKVEIEMDNESYQSISELIEFINYNTQNFTESPTTGFRGFE